MNEHVEVIDLSFSSLTIKKKYIGEDIHVIAYGGEKPHIGSMIMCIPRPSLSGDSSISCTSSVLNVTGHKDEDILRAIAEKICRKENRIVTCTGGFHVDNMTSLQIKELKEKITQLTT